MLRQHSEGFRKYIVELPESERAKVSRTNIRFDTKIQSLICQHCNRTWAAGLEAAAGNHLYDFMYGSSAIDAQLVTRWAWFFAIKIWWFYRNTKVLADGPLSPILGKLMNPNVQCEIPVGIARFQVPAKSENRQIYRFLLAHDIDGHSGRGGFIWWVLGRKLAFMLPIPIEGQPLVTPSVPIVKVQQGLRISSLPTQKIGVLRQVFPGIETV